MAEGRRFLDTNVLLYSISRAPAEQAKREVAVELLERDDNVLSVQVLQEFYVQATRVSRTDALSHTLAEGLIRTWLRFPVQDVSSGVLLGALQIKQEYGFSYWDSAIVAAARVSGCQELYTEDLTHGRVVGGVAIVNPFR